MPFKNLVTPKQLQEYTIMNIEPIEEHEKHKFAGQGAVSKKVKVTMLFILENLIIKFKNVSNNIISNNIYFLNYSMF